MSDIEKRILNQIDSMKQDIIEFHQEIIKIPSENPPGKYKEIASFVKNKFDELGLDTKIKRNNVIGSHERSENPSLIFYGHMDTVEAFKGWTRDPFGAELINGRIYGRGACDDKASVTAEIFATKALMESEADLKGKLTLLSVVDEEMGGYGGAKLILDRGYVKGDACLLGDGRGDFPIGYFGGSMFVTFLVKGKQAHGMSFPDLKGYRNEQSGINAIQKMIKVLNFLEDLQEEFYSIETKYLPYPNYPSKISHINVAVIEGGTKISIVPDKCLLHCSIHTIPEKKIEDIKNRINKFAEEYMQNDPDLDLRITIPLAYEPHLINTKSKFAKAMSNSIKTVFNDDRDFRLNVATNDAHWFQEKGIETIEFGCGGGNNNVHAADEFVEINDLLNTTKVFAITALNYLK
jgi:succinyl-diaminopimelate desuccinylase